MIDPLKPWAPNPQTSSNRNLAASKHDLTRIHTIREQPILSPNRRNMPSKPIHTPYPATNPIQPITYLDHLERCPVEMPK